MKKYIFKTFCCILTTSVLSVPCTVLASNNIEFIEGRITNIQNPINDQDAATKKYIDDAINSIPKPVAVLNTFGQSETATVSQKAMTEAISDIPKVLQSFGQSETAVISQNTLTDAISALQNEDNIIKKSVNDSTSMVFGVTSSASGNLNFRKRCGLVTVSGQITLGLINNGADYYLGYMPLEYTPIAEVITRCKITVGANHTYSGIMHFKPNRNIRFFNTTFNAAPIPNGAICDVYVIYDTI